MSDAPAMLKSIWHEKVFPEIVHVKAAIIRLPNGVKSGNWQTKPDDDTKEYVHADRIAALEAEVSDARKMADEYYRWLGELLAVVHRDGGQHLDENGPEDSVRDAHEVWADTMAGMEALTAERDALAEKLERVVEALETIAKPKVGPDFDWTEHRADRWRAVWYRKYEDIARATLAALKDTTP